MTTREAIDTLRLMMRLDPDEVKAVGMATKALERRVGKFPEYRNGKGWTCPTCKKRTNKNMPFCCYCGQGFDWSEV